MEFSVNARYGYERDPLILSCNASNGSWKFCRWAKGDDISCTFKYEYISESGKWVVTKCRDSKQDNCKECSGAFQEFEFEHKEKSLDGISNTMCEIKKPSAVMLIDDGEYVCQLLKCATPEDGGCKITSERFQKYDIMQTEETHSVNIQVSVNDRCLQKVHLKLILCTIT